MDNHPLQGQRGEEHDILKLIGARGDDWEIVACEGQGSTSYYPAVDDDGNEVGYFDWPTLDDYLKHKIKKTRLTVRYTVLGNPISAEEYVQDTLGCHAMAIGPHTLDVYYATDNPTSNP